MATVNIDGQQPHADNLKDEVAGRNVEQAEKEEPEAAEIECQQTVPEDDRPRLAEKLLAHALRDGIGPAILLAQGGQQVLEPRRHGLLLLGVVDI